MVKSKSRPGPESRRSPVGPAEEIQAAEEFAGRLRQIIAIRRLPQNEVAAKLGVSPSVLSKITAAQFRRLAIPTIERTSHWATELGVSFWWLLTGEGAMEELATSWSHSPAEHEPVSLDAALRRLLREELKAILIASDRF